MNKHSLLILTHMRNDIQRIRERDNSITPPEQQYLNEILLYLDKFETAEA